MEKRGSGQTSLDLGLALALVSAAGFAISGPLATSLLRIGWSPATAVTVRLLIAAAALAVPAFLQLRTRGSALRRAWRIVVFYGVVPVAGAQVCYFEAVARLSVPVALLLEYSGILMVVGWMWARHHQRPTRTTAAGTVCALVGLVLVLDLTGEHHIALSGVGWGLAAAVGLALYFVVSARDGDGGLPPLCVAWGGLASGSAVMLGAAMVGLVQVSAPLRSVTLAGKQVSWVAPVAGIGLVAAAFAYVTGIAAARRLGARIASFVGLAEVLFAAAYSWLLLGERLTATQICGGVLVILGVAAVRLGEPAIGDTEPPPAPT